MLKVEELFFKFRDKEILKEVSMQVCPGELICIAGPNGSGKTTLLRCLLDILRPYKGTITADGQDLQKLSSRLRAKQLSYVSQNSPSKFPMTVFDMVLMGRRPYLNWRPSEGDLAKVGLVLETMAIDHLSMQEFDRLSGGQQQKVLLARAFVQEAKYMLLDEPTNSLDLRHQLEVMDTLKQIVREKGIGAVVAIHDLNMVQKYSDRVVLMKKGGIYGTGPPDEVMTPEAILRIYGVKVRYISDNGNRYLVPVGT